MKALTVKIAADTKGFNAGIKGAQGNVQHFSKTTKRAMLGVAAATAGAVAVFSKWADQLDRIGKLSTRLGKSAESLQRIGFAAARRRDSTYDALNNVFYSRSLFCAD